MTLNYLPSYLNSFLRWGFASPETHLKNNEYINFGRPKPDPVITRIIDEQNLPPSLTYPTPTLANPVNPALPVNPDYIPSPPLSPSGPVEVPSPADPLIKPGSPPPPPPGDVPWANPFASLGPLLPLIKLAGRILPLIPPLLYDLYNSEIWVLQNIDVKNIVATSTSRRYSVGFGNKAGKEICLDFEVVAGKFYKDEVIHSKEGFAPVIFETKSWVSYIPLIRRFELNREIYKTQCNIMIDDPGNSSLQNGPVSVYHRLSENEGINLIYRDPFVNKDMTYDHYYKAGQSKFTKFREAEVVVAPMGKYEDEHSQRELLGNFGDSAWKVNGYYLTVKQYLLGKKTFM